MNTLLIFFTSFEIFLLIIYFRRLSIKHIRVLFPCLTYIFILELPGLNGLIDIFTSPITSFESSF